MQLLLITVFATLIGGPRHSVQLAPPDSSYLTFTLEKGTITVQLLRWSKRATTASELNYFVDTHLPGVDPEKIIVIGDPKAKYKEFAPILEVLKKHGWMKFKLQNKDEKLKAPYPPPAGKRIAGLDGLDGMEKKKDCYVNDMGEITRFYA